MRLFCAMVLAVTAALCTRTAAQVQTEVPPAVPGAKPLTEERIKVRGVALEGNLEGNTVARDVLVILPPSYAGQKSRRYPVVCALHGYSIDIPARWAANAPLAFVDQYVGSLFRYRAIAIDVCDQDGLRADAGKLHEVLDRYGVADGFEVYQGTHTSKAADRLQNRVMPFFSRSLCFRPGCR